MTKSRIEVGFDPTTDGRGMESFAGKLRKSSCWRTIVGKNHMVMDAYIERMTKIHGRFYAMYFPEEADGFFMDKVLCDYRQRNSIYFYGGDDLQLARQGYWKVYLEVLV